jgi:hypothetical protein
MVKLPSYQYSVVIGLLLSEGWLILPNPHSKSARLGLEQSGYNYKYFCASHVFLSLAHYCSSNPIVRNRTRFDKQTISLQFFFIEHYHIFQNYIISSTSMGLK